MKAMDKFIGVQIDGELTVHVVSVEGDYETLCGIDPNDDNVGHEGVVPLPANPKVCCPDCTAAVLGVRRLGLRKSDFLNPPNRT